MILYASFGHLLDTTIYLDIPILGYNTFYVMYQSVCPYMSYNYIGLIMLIYVLIPVRELSFLTVSSLGISWLILHINFPCELEYQHILVR